MQAALTSFHSAVMRAVASCMCICINQAIFFCRIINLGMGIVEIGLQLNTLLTVVHSTSTQSIPVSKGVLITVNYIAGGFRSYRYAGSRSILLTVSRRDWHEANRQQIRHVT